MMQIKYYNRGLPLLAPVDRVSQRKICSQENYTPSDSRKYIILTINRTICTHSGEVFSTQPFRNNPIWRLHPVENPSKAFAQWHTTSETSTLLTQHIGRRLKSSSLLRDILRPQEPVAVLETYRPFAFGNFNAWKRVWAKSCFDTQTSSRVYTM